MENQDIQADTAQTPLLEDQQDVEATNEKTNKIAVPNKLSTLLFRIFIDSLPVTLSNFVFLADRSFLIYLLKSTHASNEVIASYGISASFQALVSLILALQTGLLSRVSQAFGAKNIQLAGLYCQRGQVINVGATILVLILFSFGKQILLLLKAKEEQAEMGQSYLFYTMPGTICQIFFFSYQSVLNGCKVYFIPALCTVVGAVAQLILGQIFIKEYSLGLQGAGLSQSVGWMLTLASMYIIVKCKKPVPGLFFKFSKESFVGIWDLLKFQLICGLQGWAKLASIEANNLSAIRFNEHEQAAFTVSLHDYKLFLSPVVGLTTSLQAYMGNIMGLGNAKLAKKTLNYTIFISLIIIAIIEIVAFAIRGTIIGSQTDEKNFDIAIKIFSIFQVSIALEFISDLYKAASKAIGKEKMALKLALIVYVLYNVPSTFILSFLLDFGVYGLALATTSGACIIAITFTIITNSQDWEKSVKEVTSALKNSQGIYRRLTMSKQELSKSIESVGPLRQSTLENTANQGEGNDIY